MSLKISIITPSFNQARYIKETIESIHSQNYPDLEHLVIDGSSTDNTVEILKQYEHHLRWISEPDSGQANAINKGFRQATGDIVTWLNSDDVYLPQTLRRVADFLTRHPQVDVIYGDYVLIDNEGQVLLRKKEIPFDYNILLYGLDYISQPTTFFRRSIFDKVGYLDESLHYGLDWEYWLRIAARGGKFAHIPDYLAATRWHIEAKTLDAPPEMYTEHEAIRNRYWKKRRFQAPGWHRLYKMWLNKYYRLKRQALKIILRQTVDFPPGNWILNTARKQGHLKAAER